MNVEQLQKRFGGLVRTYRKDAHKTQEQLAEEAGVSVDMITRIESGATGVRFPNLVKIANALRVDPAELFAADIPKGTLAKGPFKELLPQLANLPDKDIERAVDVLKAVLKHP
jgi:transcriptional regulator with XRE-family HTH domain